MILTLEFGPRDAVLAWADSVLRQHLATPAIVVTHAYLESDDRRYDHDTPELDWNPHRYVDTSAPAASTTGRRSGASSSRATATCASCCAATIWATASDA